MDRPIVIIHFQALEKYPPVMNLINYLQDYHKTVRIEVITTQNTVDNIRDFQVKNGSIIINRIGRFGKAQNLISRTWNYIYFYFFAIVKIIQIRPKKVLYYETLSSFPVFIYKKYLNSSAEVFIHYHEYTSPVEYANGMMLSRYFHKCETYLYRYAVWISQTNEERMKLFIKDESLERTDRFMICPNYPPRSWLRVPSSVVSRPFKMVYVGALSLDSMYSMELFNWVVSKTGGVTLDIYSSNITDDVIESINAINSPNIKLNSGVDYFSLPEILRNFHVGVILYNGHIPNYIYNAPNKLFEYLACGLDVWFSKDIQGCYPFISTNTFPKVCLVDFTKLNDIEESLFFHDNCTLKESEYFAESVLSIICKRLVNAR
jgi:hypothetical protein